MTSQAPNYHRYRFPPAIISHAVWLYHRFCLKPKKVALIASMRKLLTILNAMMRTNTSWRQMNHQEMA